MRQNIVPDDIAEIEDVDDLLFSGDFADVVSELGEGVDERHHHLLPIGRIHAVGIGGRGEANLVGGRANGAEHLGKEDERRKKRGRGRRS